MPEALPPVSVQLHALLQLEAAHLSACRAPALLAQLRWGRMKVGTEQLTGRVCEQGAQHSVPAVRKQGSRDVQRSCTLNWHKAVQHWSSERARGSAKCTCRGACCRRDTTDCSWGQVTSRA